MAKMTLLDLTQSILSPLDSDEVNSIHDSQEAMQVVNVLKTVYYDFITQANVPELYTLFELNASDNPNKPTLMSIPEGYHNVLWLKYNKATHEDPTPNFDRVEYLSLPEFLERMHSLKVTDTSVGTFIHRVDSSDIEFFYTKDRSPSFYTSFDDRTILFDSYDSGVETTLQKQKSLCYGEKNVIFTIEDDFIPHMDASLFPLYLNEAKATAFAELKQTQNVKAEQKARRGWIHLQTSKNAVDQRKALQKLPRYGRK